jgi:hypothetical protein
LIISKQEGCLSFVESVLHTTQACNEGDLKVYYEKEAYSREYIFSSMTSPLWLFPYWAITLPGSIPGRGQPWAIQRRRRKREEVYLYNEDGGPEVLRF